MTWDWLILIRFGSYFRFTRYWGVPLLLLYMKTNCSRRKLTGSKQVIKGCEKTHTASEFKTDGCTLICFNYIFFGTLFFNFQKFWGGGGGSSSPTYPSPATCHCHLIFRCLLINHFRVCRSTSGLNFLPTPQTALPDKLCISISIYSRAVVSSKAKLLWPPYTSTKAINFFLFLLLFVILFLCSYIQCKYYIQV